MPHVPVKISQSEQALFQKAMKDVSPLFDKNRVPKSQPLSAQLVQKQNSNSTASLAKEKQSPFQIIQKGEFVQGRAEGVNQKIILSLQKGNHPPQAILDLHQLSLEQAHKKVHQFITSSYEKGFQFLLLIHGRGLHSQQASPVLKNQVIQWLIQMPLCSLLVGFCSASPQQGGTGALLIQLRRKNRL